MDFQSFCLSSWPLLVRPILPCILPVSSVKALAPCLLPWAGP